MFVLVFTTCNHGDKRIQEQDIVLSECLVAYYRQDRENPPVNFFRGSLNKFLQLSEIPPYGKVLKRSCTNNREATVVVVGRQSGYNVTLVAEERDGIIR